MNNFLSDENIALHSEYQRNIRLKYSIFESSYPMLVGASMKDILHFRLSSRDKGEVTKLLAEMELHDVYFSSFGNERFPRSVNVADQYGSESAFLNELFRLAMSLRYGFVTVDMNGRNISLSTVCDCENIQRFHRPLLAIDVCEHAYFMDYGFDKERYLLNALPYLDITKLTVADTRRLK